MVLLFTNTITIRFILDKCLTPNLCCCYLGPPYHKLIYILYETELSLSVDTE